MLQACLRKGPYLLVLMFFFVCYYANNTEYAYGNAAVWNVGTIEGVPGPLKQHDLVLERERVIFKKWDKVYARFWVNNPTSKEIKETIGFPLEYVDKSKDAENYIEHINALLKEFVVKVGDKTAEVKLTNSLQSYLLSKMVLRKNERDQRRPSAINGEYPIVFVWDMSFPPQSTTEFTVEYPLYPSSQGNEFVSSFSFSYITHTGSYWAKPIKEAIFEYCGEDRFFLNNIGTAITSWTYSPPELHGWYIEPRPFEIDVEAGCIVWRRANWTPIKTDDDIRFSTYENRATSLKLNVPDFSHQFWQWCGFTNDKRKRGVFVAHQFAEIFHLNDRVYSQTQILALANRAYNFVLHSPKQAFENSYDDLPEYLKIDFLSVFLRYLRNYIFATHGHEFNDENLANCFANVPSSGKKLSELEKRNVDLIMTMEKQLKDGNRDAWKKLIEVEDMRHYSTSSMDD